MNNDPTLSALLIKFAEADCCWFASTRPDGRAHLAPIWHVWHQDAAYVVTRSSAVRTANIRHNPAVSLSLPDPMNVFIIEGIAQIVAEADDELAALFQTKFDWNIHTDKEYDTIIRIDPLKAMAWGSHGQGRWHFGAQE